MEDWRRCPLLLGATYRGRTGLGFLPNPYAYGNRFLYYWKFAYTIGSYCR